MQGFIQDFFLAGEADGRVVHSLRGKLTSLGGGGGVESLAGEASSAPLSLDETLLVYLADWLLGSQRKVCS